MNDLSPLVIALSAIAAVMVAIGITALAYDCWCWFRQHQATRDVFRACDRWHGEHDAAYKIEVQIKARKARGK